MFTEINMQYNSCSPGDLLKNASRYLEFNYSSRACFSKEMTFFLQTLFITTL